MRFLRCRGPARRTRAVAFVGAWAILCAPPASALESDSDAHRFAFDTEKPTVVFDFDKTLAMEVDPELVGADLRIQDSQTKAIGYEYAGKVGYKALYHGAEPIIEVAAERYNLVLASDLVRTVIEQTLEVATLPGGERMLDAFGGRLFTREELESIKGRGDLKAQQEADPELYDYMRLVRTEHATYTKAMTYLLRQAGYAVDEEQFAIVDDDPSYAGIDFQNWFWLARAFSIERLQSPESTFQEAEHFEGFWGEKSAAAQLRRGVYVARNQLFGTLGVLEQLELRYRGPEKVPFPKELRAIQLDGRGDRDPIPQAESHINRGLTIVNEHLDSLGAKRISTVPAYRTLHTP